MRAHTHTHTHTHSKNTRTHAHAHTTRTRTNTLSLSHTHTHTHTQPVVSQSTFSVCQHPQLSARTLVARASACTHTYIYTHAHKRTHAHVRTKHASVHHTRAYAHIHTHTCAHTHTHTCLLRAMWRMRAAHESRSTEYLREPRVYHLPLSILFRLCVHLLAPVLFICLVIQCCLFFLGRGREPGWGCMVLYIREYAL